MAFSKNHTLEDLLFTQLVKDAPIAIVDTEPLAVARADVDVDRAEVVILLVTWGPRTLNLHVQLGGVHSQY